jgi:uncharacterized protein (DUF488 family)
LAQAEIVTIGYGNRTMASFTALLQKFGIRHLVDVRSKPFSRFNPDFTKDALEANLVKAGIGYLYGGVQLGGIPEGAARTEKGQIDYLKVQERPEFQDGLRQLQRRAKRGNLALMCSELRPEECHRCKLLGTSLASQGIDILHIDERGELITQVQALARLTGGNGTLDVGLSGQLHQSRRSYT